MYIIILLTHLVSALIEVPVLHLFMLVKVIEKQLTGTGAIKRQTPLLKQKREINIYYK